MKINTELANKIIFLAWSDKVSFEEIYQKTNFTESEVIKFMRKKLKPTSFINWRKRVKGRKSKHKKLSKFSYD